MNKIDILNKLNSLDFDKERVIIISGASLVMQDIIEETNDIDMATDLDYYNSLDWEKRIGAFNKEIKVNGIFEISDNLYEKDEYVLINGYKFMNLKTILKIKKALNREKDKEVIERINKLLEDEIEIRKEYMTDEIIKDVMKLDVLVYGEEYTYEWYKKTYKETDEIICLYDEDKLIGYVMVIPITKSYYDEFKEGKYSTDINLDRNRFSDTYEYSYISSINILEEYRGFGYGGKLLNEAFNNYKGNIIAIAVTKEGHKLSSKYMTFIKSVNEEESVFEKINKEFTLL